MNVLAPALGITKTHPRLTPPLPKLPMQIPCRVGTGSQRSARQFYFNQSMPRQPQVVSPPPTLLIPQSSGSVLPWLTRLQFQKCLTSQEQLLLDLHIQNFGPNQVSHPIHLGQCPGYRASGWDSRPRRHQSILLRNCSKSCDTAAKDPSYLCPHASKCQV